MLPTMFRRRTGWTVAAGVLLGAVALSGAGCRSAKVSAGGLEIEIVGDDGFLVQARGLEAALKMSLAHVEELESDPKGNKAAIVDWNRIIVDRIVAKQKQGEEIPS